jgi:ribosome-binding factor A
MGKRDSRRTRGPSPGGIDPSGFASSRSDKKTERKTHQLCREVRDVLSVALASLDDESLSDVWVADVLPGADPSHLRVVVMLPRASTDPSAGSTVGELQRLDEVYLALRKAAGLLRSEVANAIARKRTPQLNFEVHAEGGHAEREEP